MKLTVDRLFFLQTYTIGVLMIDGKPFCFTLEDVVRPNGEKVMHETAIPAGSYKVVMTMSQRFGKVMPQVLDVPNFSGIRIHAGNTDKDTSGCLLVGYGASLTDAKNLTSSGLAYEALVRKLNAAIGEKQDIAIEIINHEARK